jgi:PIN domain nuclease of toxin-antitoxin system
VRLLLDTHALLWWLGDDPILRTEARDAISDPESWVAVSAASAWEISIKQAVGKLRAPSGLASTLEANNLIELPISLAHALRAGELPRRHSDPFDRMLVAQAELEDLTIVTRDPHFAAYGVPLLAA